ncbi:MAG: hypothetical protein HWN68_15930 [Desulfobacterales bacterium]|nr:hypothetical protein [Desulfobacterales bacterium]
MFKNISIILIFVMVLGLSSCIGPDKNRPPSVAEISCPTTAKMEESVTISVVAHDRDGDRIAYKVTFGDGVESEWSDFLPSGQAKTFYHTYNRAGTFGIYAIASDHHHLNSGWSQKTFIKVTPIVREFVKIGTTSDAFFWSLRDWRGKLYAGTYGYPKLYNFPPWTRLKKLGAGESVTGIEEFLGTLFCNTENRGRIYRMNPADPTDWTVVHDDDWPWGIGMAVLGSHIYAGFVRGGLEETKILYSSDGTSWPQADYWFGGELVFWSILTYDGYVYALGSKKSTSKTWARRGIQTSWADAPALCNIATGYWDMALPFIDGYLYLAMGRRTDGKTKLYRFDGSSLSDELFSLTAYYAVGACIYEGNMWWLFGSHHMNNPPSPTYYYLYRTPTGHPGSWEHLKTFSVTPIYSHGKYRTKGAVWPLGNKLYVAVQNKVYRMDEEAPLPQE